MREDLKKILNPFQVEDLYISFLDAAAFIEAEKEDDPSRAEKLQKKSGMTTFQENLTRFVQEKGKAGKLSSSLYILERVLQEAIASLSSGDPSVDGLEEILLQRRQTIAETRRNISEDFRREGNGSAARVRDHGRKVADAIHGAAHPEDINRELDNAQSAVERESADMAKVFEKIFRDHLQGLDHRLQEITESPVARLLLENLQGIVAKNVATGRVSAASVNGIRQVTGLSARLGEFLVKNSFNPQGNTFLGLYKLNQYSGTNVHAWVKTIGGLIGKRFRPFEAIRWTRFISNAGRCLAVVGTALTFILEIKHEAEEAKQAAELRDSRMAIRAGFNDAADAIQMHYDANSRKFIAAALDPEIEAIDHQLSEIRKMKSEKIANLSELQVMLAETQNLINQLHAVPS